VSALVTDRFARYKEMAALGYGASLVSRVGFVTTGGTAGLTALLALDRIGKGMRTAPRDALISLSVVPQHLGMAFGVHRAMDAFGAMLGPIVAFIVLQTIVDGFDVVFVFSLCSAVIGISILALLVHNKKPERISSVVPIPMSAVKELLRNPAFRHLAVSAFLLGSMTISDGFLYLTLQERSHLSSGMFPLLYVVTSAGYLLFAIPMGRLADKLGRFPLFLFGHTLLIALYVALIAAPSGFTMITLGLTVLGLYYACTEGVLMALGSALVPEQLRTSGLAILTNVLAVARFAGSVLFGLFWTSFGLQLAVVIYLLGMTIAVCMVTATRPKSVAS
jgi:MFS family permease